MSIYLSIYSIHISSYLSIYVYIYIFILSIYPYIYMSIYFFYLCTRKVLDDLFFLMHFLNTLLSLIRFVVMYMREFIIEKQSPICINKQLSWLNVCPPYHDWFRSLDNEKGYYLSLIKGKWAKKALILVLDKITLPLIFYYIISIDVPILCVVYLYIS